MTQSTQIFLIFENYPIHCALLSLMMKKTLLQNVYDILCSLYIFQIPDNIIYINRTGVHVYVYNIQYLKIQIA